MSARAVRKLDIGCGRDKLADAQTSLSRKQDPVHRRERWFEHLSFRLGVSAPPWVLVAALVSTVVAVRTLHLMTGSREHLITFVPDDAFYYMGLGRGFVLHHRWTFDGGVSASTGFHLLQAYLCAVSWALLHTMGPDAPVFGIMAIGAMATTVAVFLLSPFLERTWGAYALIALPVVFLARNPLICSGSAMEWPLGVVACSWAMIILRGPSFDSGRRYILNAALCGFFGVMARSDTVVSLSLMAVMSVAVYRRAALLRAAALAAGIAAGLAVLALHTFSITGDWIQDSVTAKLYWGRFAGLSFSASLRELAPTLGLQWLGKGLDRLLFLGGILAGFLMGAYDAEARRISFWSASSILLGTLLVDARNSGGLQFWYTYAAVVPCIVLFGGGASMMAAKKPQFRKASVVAALMVVVINLEAAREGPWPNQVAMLHAAERLATDDEWSHLRIGAWNAGIIGYYRGHDVINLDGLVNHDALKAAMSGRLLDYAVSVGVDAVVDFSAMLTRVEYRKRGGYDVPDIGKRLIAVDVLPRREPQWLDTPITFYRLVARKPGGTDSSSKAKRWRY